MSKQVTNQPTVQLALLFMPDISGFTEFVSTVEIQHAQSIIGELLEIILESNQINLEVSAIEGDAIFFYRLGKAPALEQLLEQVQHMFTGFHKQLQRYDHERICPCGACASAKHLKLKFFAHYGEVSSYNVKEHHQLFGREVIVLHRLLKNNLNKKEYTLLTNSILEQNESLNGHSLYNEAASDMEQYDVGDIHFKVIDLAVLRQQVATVEPTSIHLSDKTKVSFTEERVLTTPMEKVFLSIFDLPQRANWFEGVKGIEILKKPGVNRVGTTHRCIASTGGNPVFVTEKGNGNEKEITFVEMDPKGMGGSKFYLQKKGEKETLIRWDMLVNRNFFISLMFDLIMKRKMKKLLAKSVDNLQHYCNNAGLNGQL
jgi:hypothetical protein